jgi:hypothetical protein
MSLSVANGTGTGEFTYSDPSESFTTTIRVVNVTPKSGTFGPSAIHTSFAKA